MARGKPTTMPTKMISDMPLPMPRSVICSPSHMMKAEPVVSVRMVIKDEAEARVIDQRLAAEAGACRVAAIDVDWTMLRTMVR